MSFEPVQLLFLIIWGFFLYKALFKRRKRPPADLPPDIPPQGKNVPPPAADADGEYDYQALRKKILTTWGKQEEDKELDLPDEMEKPVYHEKPLPKPPLSATIKKKEVTAEQGALYAGKSTHGTNAGLYQTEAGKRRARASGRDASIGREVWAFRRGMDGKGCQRMGAL